MEVLSHDVIVNSLEKCNALPRYQVGFIFSNARDANIFTQDFLNTFHDDGIPGVTQIQKLQGGGRINFKSGSTIYILSYSLFCKGRRLHDFFWDEAIEEHHLSAVLEQYRPMLVRYHSMPIPEIKHSDWTDNIESSALDEFFDSLEVVS